MRQFGQARNRNGFTTTDGFDQRHRAGRLGLRRPGRGGLGKGGGCYFWIRALAGCTGRLAVGFASTPMGTPASSTSTRGATASRGVGAGSTAASAAGMTRCGIGAFGMRSRQRPRRSSPHGRRCAVFRGCFAQDRHAGFVHLHSRPASVRRAGWADKAVPVAGMGAVVGAAQMLEIDDRRRFLDCERRTGGPTRVVAIGASEGGHDGIGAGIDRRPRKAFAGGAGAHIVGVRDHAIDGGRRSARPPRLMLRSVPSRPVAGRADRPGGLN